MSSKLENLYYEEGWQAAKSGARAYENPYTLGQMEFKMWDAGYAAYEAQKGDW